MSSRTRISSCSPRIQSIAEPLGFKTLGSFRKFLKQCYPNVRLYCHGNSKTYFGNDYVRVVKVLKYVDQEMLYYQM
jgi:hypothetical protein